MKINKASTATNASGFIPEGLYRTRCIGTKFTERNGSGQPMTTLACEIIEPEVITHEGSDIRVAGQKFSLYLTHNPEKTGWASQDEVFTFCDNLKIELPAGENGEPDYDTDSHKEYFQGMEFDIILKSEEEIKRYAKKPGQKVGDPILDGEGNQISSGWRINTRPDCVSANCHPTRNEEVAALPF